MQHIISLDSEDLSSLPQRFGSTVLSFADFGTHENYGKTTLLFTLLKPNHALPWCQYSFEGFAHNDLSYHPKSSSNLDMKMLHWIELCSEDLGRSICGGSIFLLIAQSLIFAQASHLSSIIQYIPDVYLFCIYVWNNCDTIWKLEYFYHCK